MHATGCRVTDTQAYISVHPEAVAVDGQLMRVSGLQEHQAAAQVT